MGKDCSIYFTFLSLGFFALADALALRVAFAKIAPAAFLPYPSEAIFDWTFAKPGCFDAIVFS